MVSNKLMYLILHLYHTAMSMQEILDVRDRQGELLFGKLPFNYKQVECHHGTNCRFGQKKCTFWHKETWEDVDILSKKCVLCNLDKPEYNMLKNGTITLIEAKKIMETETKLARKTAEKEAVKKVDVTTKGEGSDGWITVNGKGKTKPKSNSSAWNSDTVGKMKNAASCLDPVLGRPSSTPAQLKSSTQPLRIHSADDFMKHLVMVKKKEDNKKDLVKSFNGTKTDDQRLPILQMLMQEMHADYQVTLSSNAVRELANQVKQSDPNEKDESSGSCSSSKPEAHNPTIKKMEDWNVIMEKED